MAETQKNPIVVTRFDPDRDEAPRQQRYEIPVQPDWKVLDALNYIKDHVDERLDGGRDDLWQTEGVCLRLRPAGACLAETLAKAGA